MSSGFDVEVSTDFEGANPQTPEGVIREAPTTFLLIPTQEEDNPNYKFRMDTLIINHASEPRDVELRVNWRDPTYMEPRHHLFFRSGDRWQRVQGVVQGTEVTVHAQILPGETWVSLNPKYSYSDHLADLERLRETPGVEVRTIGKSAQGRDIFAISLARGDPGDDARPAVLVEAGNHPYETSGAYCIDGMLEWLLGPGKAWRDRVDVHFIQISNPDGVAGGWCRLTGPGGVDVCHELGMSKDPTCVALRTFLEHTRPHIYVNIHGWMYNDLDNFRYGDEEAARFTVLCLLEKVGGPVYRWRMENSKPERPPVTNTWYAKARVGARPLGFDIAWNRRSDGNMRALGACMLEAVCEAAVALPRLPTAREER
jgi:hypothetical protein